MRYQCKRETARLVCRIARFNCFDTKDIFRFLLYYALRANITKSWALRDGISVQQLGNAIINRGVETEGQRALLTGDLNSETANLPRDEKVTELIIDESYGPSPRDMSEIRGLSSVDLTLLKHVDSLQFLYIACPIVAGVEAISTLSSLDTLYFGETAKAADAIRKLDFKSMNGLRRFSMHHCEGNEPFFKSDSITDLALTSVKADNLTFLNSMNGLQALQIFNSSILELTGIPDLNKLELSQLPKLTSLEPLRVCKSLQDLILEKCPKVDSVAALSNLQCLKNLSLKDCGQIDSFHPLLKLEQLERIEFMDSTDILDGDIDCLLNVSSLKFLAFRNRKHYNLTMKEWHVKKRPGQGVVNNSNQKRISFRHRVQCKQRDDQDYYVLLMSARCDSDYASATLLFSRTGTEL